MNIEQLGITKEELLNLAAHNLAEQIADISELEAKVSQEVDNRITKAIGDNLGKRIDTFLHEELLKLVDKQLVPTDMWGDPVGKPTTIRAVLQERAAKFWETKVDDKGRESSYGGVARHERVYGNIVREQFDKAIKENAELIVAQFKKAILADAVKLTTEHIDRLIKTK